MPLYETIAVAEKYSVILDLGNAYTKIGFARESGPRFIIPSEVKHPYTGQVIKIWSYKNQEELLVLLKEFVHRLYFKYLVVNPKDRRVVVVESVLCPSGFRDVLAKILFKHFEIPSLLFVPTHLMALFTLGISSALVMDAGYVETVVLPVYEGVPLLSACQVLPVGGQDIHRRIEAELMDKALVRGADPIERPLASILMEPLKESVLEDIKVRTCFVTTRERGSLIQAHELRKRLKIQLSPESEALSLQPPHDVKYPLDGRKVMTIPGYLREWSAELLFEQNADEQSVATIILDAIAKCPIDTKKVLGENVVIMGGTAMLPGFKHSLITEIKTLSKKHRFSDRLGSLREIKIHSLPAKENYVAWLGAAIFGATEAVPIRSITKEQYQQKSCIPDWSDQKWQESYGKSLA